MDLRNSNGTELKNFYFTTVYSTYTERRSASETAIEFAFL